MRRTRNCNRRPDVQCQGIHSFIHCHRENKSRFLRTFFAWIFPLREKEGKKERQKRLFFPLLAKTATFDAWAQISHLGPLKRYTHGVCYVYCLILRFPAKKRPFFSSTSDEAIIAIKALFYLLTTCGTCILFMSRMNIVYNVHKYGKMGKEGGLFQEPSIEKERELFSSSIQSGLGLEGC